MLHRRVLVAIVCLLVAVPSVPAQVLTLGDLNTRQIRALDRSHTVVFLPGGMLEEHGPYLPAFTDGILSDRLTRELAQGVATKLPGWTVLVNSVTVHSLRGADDAGNSVTVHSLRGADDAGASSRITTLWASTLGAPDRINSPPASIRTQR
jgi:Creatinine amidohydrolase